MRKLSKKENAVDVYEIGNNKYMMHMRVFNEEGKLRHIFTYIGNPGIGFIEVASSKNLDALGVADTFRSYHNNMVRMLPLLLYIAEKNMNNWNTVER